MKLVLAAALLTALAFLGSRVSVSQWILRPLQRFAGVGHLLLTGTEFAFVGLLLGGHVGLGLLDPATMAGLAPGLGLGLAWIGLLFGVQWDLRVLPASTRCLIPAALTQAALTGLIVATGTHALLRLGLGWESQASWIGALTLGAASAGTAGIPPLLGELTDTGVDRLLRTIADLDGLVPILTFGLVCCLPLLHDGDTRVWLWLGATIGLGLTVGIVVVALGAYRLAEDDLLVVLVGAVLLGGGAALMLNLSPLLVNAIAGALIANVARPRTCTMLRQLLMRGDRATYILLLLLAGAAWQPATGSTLWLALLYVVVRIAGKWLTAGWALRRWLPGDERRRIGLGLVSHDGLAVAIAVNLMLLTDQPVADLVTTVVLVGVVLNEPLAPLLARRAVTPKQAVT